MADILQPLPILLCGIIPQSIHRIRIPPIRGCSQENLSPVVQSIVYDPPPISQIAGLPDGSGWDTLIRAINKTTTFVNGVDLLKTKFGQDGFRAGRGACNIIL